MSDSLWCYDCHASRRIVDQHGESFYDGNSEYGYTVYDLSCGHDTWGDPARIGPAPGDRYAGRRTADSIRAKDLARSREETTECTE